MARERIEWPPKHRYEGFTVHRDGWAKTYKGRTIVISGKKRSERDVRARFAAKCRQIDGDAVVIPTGDMTTLLELVSAYFDSLDYRVSKGKLSERTRENIVWQCRRFTRFVGSDRLVQSIGANDFSRYHKKYADGKSPYTAGSLVAAITTMFHFAKRNGIIDKIIFGDRWVAPSRTERMDRRLRLSKTFLPDELHRLWRCADPMWRAWIALGLVCAFIPADLTNITRDVINGNTIDYRRRKTGKMRRIIPLPDEVADLIRAYKRPAPLLPEFSELVFLNKKGRQFGLYPRRNEISNEFKLLQIEAGVYRVGRNFTGLRTTAFNAMLDASAMARGLIMGRRPPDISATDWESYLEHPDLKSIRALTHSQWSHFKVQLLRG